MKARKKGGKIGDTELVKMQTLDKTKLSLAVTNIESLLWFQYFV